MNLPENILAVANGFPPSATLLHQLLPNYEMLVAVDGGLHVCLAAGLEPNLLIGDFDSVSAETRKTLNHIPQIFAHDQNKSDLEKTLEYLFNQGAVQITVCGALGQRIDHTLTNICLLCRYPGKVKFETDTEWCMALPRSCLLQCQLNQQISLIPTGDAVTALTTEGLQWELQGATLNKNFLSISNVCIKTPVSLSFASGDLVACLMKG